MPRIDAVATVAHEMDRTLAFYEALGFTFTEADRAGKHVEADAAPGETRLMIDRADLVAELHGSVPEPGAWSAFAVLCETPAEVDARIAAVEDGGFTVVTPAWDAFWGQRYATVADPWGLRIDVFAPLD